MSTFVPVAKPEPAAYTSSFVRYVSLGEPVAPDEVAVGGCWRCYNIVDLLCCAGADVTHTVFRFSLTVAVIASGIAVYASETTNSIVGWRVSACGQPE